MKKGICILWSMFSMAAISAQNVGIGTPSPTEKLEVDGNIKLTNSNKGILLNTADAPIITRAWDAFTSGAYTGAGRWGLFMEPNRLTLGIPNLFGKHFSVSGFDDNSLVSKNMFTVNWAGDVGIGTSFPEARFHIYNDSTLLAVQANGNIGLNTTAPIAKLHIRNSDNSIAMLVRASDNADIFKINQPFFRNSVEVGGNYPGAYAALNVSNRFMGVLSNPHLRLTAVNPTGGGSAAIMNFENANTVNGKYSFESFTGTDDLLHRFSFRHTKHSGANSFVYHIDENDFMGIGTTNPTQRLTVNGNINSSSLAGTGVRSVKADASGTLVTSPSTGYVSVPVFEFVKKNPSSADVLTYAPSGITGLSFPTGSTQSANAPVYFPEGARIQNIRVTYFDNSAQNIEVTLQYNITTIDGNILVATVASSGAVAGLRTTTVATPLHTVNNSTNAYYLEARPASGLTWDGSNTRIKLVIIEYQL